MRADRATGTFDVKLNPLAAYNADDSSMGRMSIDKQFHGDLQATSKGEMLSSMDRNSGSGAYVAIERVTGLLGGREGSFVLHHTGTMNRGEAQLSVRVAPDSGTAQLAGLTGTMTIDIAAGKHSYTFDYSLPESGE
jgi:uncharacterized protein DUF3224